MAASFDVAVLHDFFVDRIVHPRSIAKFVGAAESKARDGGGSVHGMDQEDVRGGNAVNLACALARLGAKVLLITHSDIEHSRLITEAFRGLGAEVRLKPLPPGLTVSIEERVNVMLSDVGGAGRFGPQLLTAKDWDGILSSRVVCSVNWAANMKGTQLLLALARRLGSRSTLFFNPSDPRDRFADYRALVQMLRRRKVVDWVSLNEHEAASTAKALGLPENNPRAACLEIAKALRARVDVHTERAVFTSSGQGVISRRTKVVRPKRLTGAGDVWDAASIAAFLRGVDDARRLEFANTAARLFVAAERLLPPTFREVSENLPSSFFQHS